MRRAVSAPAAKESNPPASPPQDGAGTSAPRRRAVTNKDLEVYRRARLENEEAYERERAERGLPSKEELRQQAEARDRKFVELSRELEAARAAEERQRLRDEAAALQTRLSIMSAQQQWQAPAPAYTNLSPYVVYQSYPFYYPYGYGRPGFQFRFGRHASFHRFPFGTPFGPVHHTPRHNVWARFPTGGASFTLRFGSGPRLAPRAPVLGPVRGGGTRR
ncbi:MAG: hypothetical protein ACRD68_11090, partial [Pyrinomonadaceae bacterium]